MIRFFETFALLFGGFFVGIYLTREYYEKIIERLKTTIHYNIKGIEIRDNKIEGYKEDIKRLETENQKLITDKQNIN